MVAWEQGAGRSSSGVHTAPSYMALVEELSQAS